MAGSPCPSNPGGSLMSLPGPVDDEPGFHTSGDNARDDGDGRARSLLGTLDGGVCRRLVRRCRIAALILLAAGLASLLVAAVAPWGVIPSLLTLTAGALLA